MKKITLFVLVFAMCLGFSSNAKAITTLDDLRGQLKMKLAQDSPQFTDAILNDFLLLAIQSTASHGFAFRGNATFVCSTGSVNAYDDAATTTMSDGGQGLFVRAMTKDENTGSHRSIWQIAPKDLNRKWLVNPPGYQYFFSFPDKIKSYFYFFTPSTTKDTVRVFWYYVPTKFYVLGADTFILCPTFYEKPIIDYALYLCYTRIKAWDLRTSVLNSFHMRISALRERYINEQPEITFGPQEIEE